MVDSLKILAGRAPIPVQIFCNERMGNKKKKKERNETFKESEEGKKGGKRIRVFSNTKLI